MELYGRRVGSGTHREKQGRIRVRVLTRRKREGRIQGGGHDSDSHLDREDQGYNAYGETQEAGQNRQAHVIFGGLVRQNFKCLGEESGLWFNMISGLYHPL